jgi:hypothetical protein
MGSGRPFCVRVIAASMGGVEGVATWSVGGDGFNVNTWSQARSDDGVCRDVPLDYIRLSCISRCATRK